MNTIKFLILLFIIAFSPFSSFPQESKNVNAPSIETILDRKISGGIKFTSVGIRDLVRESLNSVKASGGIVLLSGEGKASYTFEPAGLSLRDVLDSIVRVETGYQWNVENGVVNFIPASGSAALLDIRIDEFKVDNATAGESLDALRELAEVKTSIDALELNKFPFMLCCGLQNPSPPPPKRFSIQLKNATVKEILNAIVGEEGQAIWLYQESQDWPEKGKKYYLLRIL